MGGQSGATGGTASGGASTGGVSSSGGAGPGTGGTATGGTSSGGQPASGGFAPDGGMEAGLPDASDSGTLPFARLLSATGLYVDTKKGDLAPDVREYQPQYTLWSDGATKRRWLYLPPGTKIDTSDMDFWLYPVGTKAWKEFSRDGKRLETRLMHKKIGRAHV